MSGLIKWGIIGPGTIARTFAAGLKDAPNGKLVAVAARNPDHVSLSGGFPGARVLHGYQAIITDEEVDALYIATPHPLHAEWTMRALEAGKHVLCEKPLGLSAPVAEAMIETARRNNRFLAEAFMYRLHPQTARILTHIRDGAIGQVRLIKSSFGFHFPYDPNHRLYSNEAAGGGILDVGCYPLSMARLIAGAAAGKPYLEPVLSGTGVLGKTGVDEWASAVLKFENGIVAGISCSIAVAQDNSLRIYGTEGSIIVDDPWFCGGAKGGVWRITVTRTGAEPEVEEVEEPRHLYSFEAEAAGNAILAGRQQLAAPGCDWADTLGTLRGLDKWRADCGLIYDSEHPRPTTRTIDGRTLAVTNPMPRRTLPGVAKPASILAIGTAFLESYSQFSIVLDQYYERGGNVFDTAWFYFDGRADRMLGDWLKSRNLREEAIVIGKGAHSPLTYPDVIGWQLTESLDNLKTDYVDIYLMHRDNPAIPVGEFVDALDAEMRAGRIRSYGGSNWTRERLDAAIAYAEKNGKAKPTAVSNNFSLAEMINPVWPGCVASSDAEWRTWLASRRMTLLAWSSQARGFFTDRAGRDIFSDQSMVDSWYSPENFAKRDRAIELARKLGTSANQIALAYSLAQDLPVVPIIGPLTTGELADSLKALDIALTKQDLAYLDTGN